MPTLSKPAIEALPLLLKSLKLPHMQRQWQVFEEKAAAQGWSYSQFLTALCEHEQSGRYHLRVQRSLKASQLPSGKAISNFDFRHCPLLNQPLVMQLAEDTTWLRRSENLLVFGPSGVGKTHLVAGVGRSLVELGARVKFTPATALVQLLQRAKDALQLQAALLKLDKYELLIIDDIGYVKKTEAETSVLFELIAHRYERRSVALTSNHPFSDWDTIFADSVMTVAAVDRLVHHATIIEIQAASFRQQTALAKTAHRSSG